MHYRQGSGHADHRLSPTRNIRSARLNARTGLGLSQERRPIIARYLPHLGHHIETKSPAAFRYGTAIPETDASQLAISNHTCLDRPASATVLLPTTAFTMPRSVRRPRNGVLSRETPYVVATVQASRLPHRSDYLRRTRPLDTRPGKSFLLLRVESSAQIARFQLAW